MSCFGLKGGIGTSSRLATLADGRVATVGALVLANFGSPGELILGGRRLGPERGGEGDKGSIIMVLATDAPLDARQLRRLSLRAGAGLARTGSYFGHGSGDIALAFSTAYTIPQDPAGPMPALAMVHEALLDPLFQAAADATEQAILNGLWHAETVAGRDGHLRRGLRDWLGAASRR
jgi:D-aminopeptidase